MDENTLVAVEMPEHVAMLLSVLGFAHAVVQNDAAWTAVYDKIAADHAEDPDGPPAESQVLRARMHDAVDTVMQATEKAMVLEQLRQQLSAPPADAAPTVEAPAYDGGGMYL